MTTVREPWFFLFGYLLAFIPPMLTFIIFVLPSKNYKDEFRHGIERVFSIKIPSKSQLSSKKTSYHIK
jgi:hypothetical protein